jgi:hypothetical protein
MIKGALRGICASVPPLLAAPMPLAGRKAPVNAVRWHLSCALPAAILVAGRAGSAAGGQPRCTFVLLLVHPGPMGRAPGQPRFSPVQSKAAVGSNAMAGLAASMSDR